LIEIIGSYNNFNNLLNNNITLTLMVEDHKCTNSISYENIKYYTSNLHDWITFKHQTQYYYRITFMYSCTDN